MHSRDDYNNSSLLAISRHARNNCVLLAHACAWQSNSHECMHGHMGFPHSHNTTHKFILLQRSPPHATGTAPHMQLPLHQNHTTCCALFMCTQAATMHVPLHFPSSTLSSCPMKCNILPHLSKSTHVPDDLTSYCCYCYCYCQAPAGSSTRLGSTQGSIGRGTSIEGTTKGGAQRPGNNHGQ